MHRKAPVFNNSRPFNPVFSRQIPYSFVFFVLVVFNTVQIGNISTPFVWGCFIYCCLNTLIAYGSYGEALNLWDTSKVSVVTTMIPIFTMLFSILGHVIFPETFASLEMNWISYLGAIVVVLGAMIAAVGHKIFGK